MEPVPYGPEPAASRVLFLAIFAFLATYAVVARGLFLAATGDVVLLPATILLLTAMLVALILGGVIATEPAHRRFYLAAAILPTFTLVRLTLIGTLPPLSEEILSYLLLAATLIFYQHAAQAGLPGMRLRPGVLVRSLRDALPLGFALALAALLLLPAPPFVIPEEAVFAILAAGAVAFIDEYWFRGILQSQISGVSNPVVGWLVTVGLFVAFVASTGDLAILAYRGGLGLLLGFLVWWRRLLPLALMTRTVSVLFIGVLAPLDFSVLLPG